MVCLIIRNHSNSGNSLSLPGQIIFYFPYTFHIGCNLVSPKFLVTPKFLYIKQNVDF